MSIACVRDPFGTIRPVPAPSGNAEGRRVSPPGRPEGEGRSAQHEGPP
jgi:hypothetical protein